MSQRRPLLHPAAQAVRVHLLPPDNVDSATRRPERTPFLFLRTKPSVLKYGEEGAAGEAGTKVKRFPAAQEALLRLAVLSHTGAAVGL